MHAILESNCTVIKLPHNGYSKAQKINKINSVYRSHQVKGWKHVMIFALIIHS